MCDTSVLDSFINMPICEVTIQINQPTTCNNFSSLLLEVYVQIHHVLGVLTPRSSTTAVASSGFTIAA
jgi:hypothetical protein